MSLRPAQWPLFGVNAARRATEPERSKPPRRLDRQDRPDLKLVQGGDSPRLERFSPRARIVSLVALVIVVLFGVVAFHVMLSQGQFELSAMQARADDQQDQYERLRWQVAQLESPQRITNEAMNRLGLVQADKVTPVTPSQADMPDGRVDQSGKATTTTVDPGQWEKVKPHLSSATK